MAKNVWRKRPPCQNMCILTIGERKIVRERILNVFIIKITFRHLVIFEQTFLSLYGWGAGNGDN